jgi:reactive chlorine resistance protein C
VPTEIRTTIDKFLTGEPAVSSAGNIIARYGLVAVIGWIGICKFFTYEAQNIQPLVSNSPFMGWMYSLLSVEDFSLTLGIVEIVTALLLAVKPWFPTISLAGSLLAILIFVSTLTFLFTTPGVGEASAGGFPLLSMTGQFLIKDIVLLGVAILTLADAMKAISLGASITADHGDAQH